MISSMYGAAALKYFPFGKSRSIVSAIFGSHLTMRNTTLEAVIERTPSVALAGIWTLLLFAVIIEQGQGSAFIYFAF